MLRLISLCALFLLLNCKDQTKTPRTEGEPSKSSSTTASLFTLASPENGSVLSVDTLLSPLVDVCFQKQKPESQYTSCKLFVDGIESAAQVVNSDKGGCFALNIRQLRVGIRQLSIRFYQDANMVEQLNFAYKVECPLAPIYACQVINTYPHSVEAYTQGLFVHKGWLYEGTGQYGQSSLRKLDLKTGKVLLQTDLDKSYFGEGICLFKQQIIQLTWQNKIGFVYGVEQLNKVSEFNYPTEGWGITTDQTTIWMSDGTSSLYTLDPSTFQITGHFQVLNKNKPVSELNELEFINGEIWANVYGADYIVVIDPHTGAVKKTIDCSGLLKPSLITPQTDVLNGIAFDADKGKIYITGKNWPQLFEIQIKKR